VSTSYIIRRQRSFGLRALDTAAEHSRY